MTFDIRKMLIAEVYDHPVKNLELVETHISWVVLTGEFAYKIKKPVNFGFLDFSTLENRKRYCEQEVRLNRRLTSGIYLGVVGISAQQDELSLGGVEAIEYAVKMTQFPQSAQLDKMLAEGLLKVSHMDALAKMVARFHEQAQIAADTTEFGRVESVNRPVEENFLLINRQLSSGRYEATLSKLQRWCLAEFVKLKPALAQRKVDGFIRECHGDMHLANLIWLDPLNNKDAMSGPMAFDCIEFNEQLRWIDVISEIAFLVMDLQDRKQDLLAHRFLNTYLETSGDYAGLYVLRYYLCYRALVRAKVSTLRLQQKGISAQQQQLTLDEFNSYLDLAMQYTRHSPPRLIIMRGVSASGKSTLSQKLVDVTGAIRIRSDIERKRLFEISLDKSALSAVDTGIYSKKGSKITYAKLLEITQQTLTAGYSVIVDAVFLKQEQRVAFQSLALELKVAYVILEITAPAEVLRQRIVARDQGVSDADLNVLESQLSNWQALHETEFRRAVRVDTSEPVELDKLIQQIQSK